MTIIQNPIDIFQFLKGGGIRGYNNQSIIVKNFPQKQINLLVFDPAKHISEYKTHISICKYFYDTHIYDVEKSNGDEIARKVKSYEYAFLVDSEKEKLFKNSDDHLKYITTESVICTLTNWESYIKLLSELDTTICINEEILGKMFARLSETNSKTISYSFFSQNGGNTVSVDTTAKEARVNNLIDFISYGKIKMETVGDLSFSNGETSMNYVFNRKRFVDMTEFEKTYTFVAIYIGKIHADTLNAKNEKSSEGKNAIIRKKGMSGVIKSICSKIEPYLCKFNNDNCKSVSLSEIIAYFKNTDNTEKIIFDLLIGSMIKHSIKFNTVINSWGISILNDHNELKVVDIIKDKMKHISVTNNTPQAKLMEIYSIFGVRYLKNINPDFSELDNFDFFIYNILFSNTFTVNENTPTRPIIGIEVIDLCIEDINLYFRKKENHFQRKQHFFKSFDGSLNNLVEYRNKIVSKEKSIDYSLIPNIVTKEQIKKTVFATLFTF